jgi:hypothetical protein
MRLRRERVQAKNRSNRRAGALALAVLAPFLLASGPAKPEPAPQKATASNEFRWFPAFMLQKKENGFSVKNVYLGFTSEGLDYIYRVKVKRKHCTDNLDNKVLCYENPSEIRHKTRMRHRRMLKLFFSNINGLATGNPQLLGILRNNVYFMLPSGCAGRYLESAVNQHPYMVLDERGIPLASCIPKCSGLDLLNFSSEVGKESTREVFLHETLHDGWFGILSEKSRKEFLSVIKPLCKDCGKFSYSGVWFLAMMTTEEKNPKEMLHETKMSQGVIKGFLQEEFPSLSREERKELKEALEWYIDLRALLDNNVMVRFLGMERFIELEAYTYMFDSNLVPYAFRQLYLPVIDEKELDPHIFAPDNSYLSSVESMEALVPILKAFMRYANELMGFEDNNISIEAGYR